jgi:hypothetical protein
MRRSKAPKSRNDLRTDLSKKPTARSDENASQKRSKKKKNSFRAMTVSKNQKIKILS